MDPHLFFATDAWGDTSLWFGAGREDPRPELIELGNMSIAARKALWTAIADNPTIPDLEDNT